MQRRSSQLNMYATYAVAKRKPEKNQACRDSNPDLCETWVRAREYRKRVICVVVSFLFHYCNPRSIASLNYNYQWRQFCRREMSRWDIACVACRPCAPFTFSPPSWTMTYFVGLRTNKRLPISARWSKTKMTLLPSNYKVFETVKQDQSMQMQTRACHA